MFAYPLEPSEFPASEPIPVPPFGSRISTVAAHDGLFDLRDTDLYLSTGSRTRPSTRRIMRGTLRQVAPGRYTAMIFDEATDALLPVELRGYTPLEVA